jgi:predicted alpha/beta-hydrolase family hydrolase
VVSQISIERFVDLAGEPAVRGFLHLPRTENGDALVLTHGAGANCESKLLVAVANAFAETGFKVLRCDLPFRQMRRHGPPFPAGAARDRDGLRRAMAALKARTLKERQGRVFLGGHSYGGRQATMLVAEEPESADGLLLLAYPLHPPRKPSAPRLGHFAALGKPALFVHGDRDPFGSIEEMKTALELIPGRKMLLEIPGAGHDLIGKNTFSDLPIRIVTTLQVFLTESSSQREKI